MCAWGPAASSLKLNWRQPAVKLDCLSLSGGLSLPRWKEGEYSGPKALLVEAHFEVFNVWHTLTHCQKHNDLQTAILSIKKAWQSHSIGPHTQSYTPIKSGKQWLSILSKRLYLAPTQKLALLQFQEANPFDCLTTGDNILCYSDTMIFGVLFSLGVYSIHSSRIDHVGEQILRDSMVLVLPSFWENYKSLYLSRLSIGTSLDFSLSSEAWDL